MSEPNIQSVSSSLTINSSPMEWGQNEWRDFYMAYSTYIHRIIYRWVRDEEKAADLLQQTFALAYKKRDELPFPSGTKTWLYKSARFFMLDQYKKDKRESERYIKTDESERYAEDASTVETNLKLKDLMAQALETLSESLREAVILVKLEGHSTDEAAEILGIKPGTLRQRVARGTAELRDAFERLDQNEQDNTKSTNSEELR